MLAYIACLISNFINIVCICIMKMLSQTNLTYLTISKSKSNFISEKRNVACPYVTCYITVVGNF